MRDRERVGYRERVRESGEERSVGERDADAASAAFGQSRRRRCCHPTTAAFLDVLVAVVTSSLNLRGAGLTAFVPAPTADVRERLFTVFDFALGYVACVFCQRLADQCRLRTRANSYGRVESGLLFVGLGGGEHRFFPRPSPMTGTM